MHDPNGFARRLDLALRARRIGKMHALAVALGIDESALSRWRRGRSISIDNLIRLSRHLGISIDWLLTGAGPMDAPAIERAAAQHAEIVANLTVLDHDTCEHLAGLMRHLAVTHRVERLVASTLTSTVCAAPARPFQERDLGH